VFLFGGVGTDSVNVERNSLGDYTVKFFGDFGSFDTNPGTTDRAEMIILATVTQGDGTYVASADQANSPGTCNSLGRQDQINVCVRIWQSDSPTTLADQNFSVAVLR